MCADFILLYSIVILVFVTTCLWKKKKKTVLKIKTSASDILQVCYLWFIAKATCRNLQKYISQQTKSCRRSRSAHLPEQHKDPLAASAVVSCYYQPSELPE